MNLTGTWRNQAGSTLTLQHSGGTLQGAYQTTLGLPDETESFEVVGRVTGTQLGMLVSWGDAIGSVTAWVGYVDGPNTLRTQWQLAREASGEGVIPMSVVAGSSVFERVP